MIRERQCWENVVNLKTVKYMKEYCNKLKKRICLQKSCAEWLEHLKKVRRYLRDGSFCSWAPAINEKASAEPASHPPARSIHIAGTEPATSPSNASSNQRAPKPEKERHRQIRKCSGCGEPQANAPRGTHVDEVREKFHSRFGWCPKQHRFVSNATCSCCGKVRNQDMENHEPNGSCRTTQRYPGTRGS